MNHERAIKVIRKSPFAPCIDVLSASLKTGIRLRTQAATPKTLPLGASRLGGVPDLPPDISGPQDQGLALSFLAQFNLSEATQFDADNLLPATGWLYFFYEAAQQPWGYEPAHEGGFRVLYAPHTALLKRVGPPKNLPQYGQQFTERPYAVRFEAESQLPDYQVHADYFETLDWEDVGDVDEVYEELQAQLHGPESDWTGHHPHHHLLGHAQIIQGEMTNSCQLMAHGLGRLGMKDPRVKKLLAAQNDWLLLLQIDTDVNGPGWTWGDNGRLYFYIRKQDLLLHNFEAAWLFLQCG